MVVVRVDRGPTRALLAAGTVSGTSTKELNVAVSVQQISPARDGSTTDVRVEQGQHVEVCDGALVVLDSVEGNRVALFAPGTWLSAQLDE